jgi:hypothetical protein
MDVLTTVALTLAAIVVVSVISILAIVFLAAFLGEPLSNSQEDFEESDALIESSRKR